TLLFTNAGMNQFKDVFLGNESRPYRRATTSQKCMRVSGKHNDFREVGRSNRHHTFFEMLGNFSFGDYFKTEAVRFAWELVTRDFGLSPRQLRITVYRDDDEAWKIWRDEVGIPSENIYRLGEKDNFWAMGETGPCGPCSEVHYDLGRSPLPDHPDCDLTCPCGRWVEIWNLVFMQFNRDASGALTPLPSPSIDTGMGFERITTILQGKSSNYETDLFLPLIEEISRISNISYGSGPGQDVSMRIISDHARAAAFVVSDGQFPGNDKRGYVLRKIMRRGIVHGKRLGIHDPFLFRIAGKVIELMGGAYPEIVAARETVARVIRQEETAFAETLDQGLKDFNERAREHSAAGSGVLPGDVAFYLYDTRGLPLEIIEDLAQEMGLTVDVAAFEAALEEQRDRSRRDYLSGKIREEVAQTVFEGTTEFVGYDCSGPVAGAIQAIVVEGERAESIHEGQAGEIVLNPSPFYAEAGGQVGDTGHIAGDGGRAEVTGTLYRGTAISHAVEVRKGSLQVGDRVEAAVDLARRARTMKNHTATHLLHAALKNILGSHVKQAGSLVAPDRLRFDFTHFAPLTAAEIDEIENQVNRQIWLNTGLQTGLMELEQALRSGAVALFGEKYQEQVRVVEVPGFSRELCGGTHVAATGTIGLFKIVSEGGIAAGIRRIEAVTGPGALDRFRAAERLLDFVRDEYKVSREEIPAFLEKLQAQARDLQREVGEVKLQSARAGIAGMLGQVRKVREVQVLAQELPETDRAHMRALADDLKHKLGSGIVILGAPQENKAALIVMVSDDLAKRIPAGSIVRKIAPLVGGSGGGKPELAEAGGKDSSKLADAIRQSYFIVEELLSAK
ncbi:MAG: alanine--tRNA ligase, partial [Acidobacteria bacterium]|nr:alanine--tRNA ligase [Acidobacteriota bacterium]